MLGQESLKGRSFINYLKEQGYAEIAMLYESDPKEKFNLALKSGNLNEALGSAKELNEKEHFLHLLSEAQKQGNAPIIEKCL